MKYILIIFILISGLLYAEPNYYPLTSLGEGFGATWCVNCPDAIAGMEVLEQNTHNGELINVHYYTTSGDLSSPAIENRFTYYEVFGVPAFIMNGKARVDGGGPTVIDGTDYLTAYRPYRFAGAPLKMEVTGWQASTGRMTGNIELVSSMDMINVRKYYLLIEDTPTAGVDRAVRDIAYETFSLSGLGSINTVDHTFTIQPSWNPANLWVAMFVQLPDDTILQSASSLELPAYDLRAAMDWDPHQVIPAGQAYTSSPFWLFNLGVSDNYQVQIVVDSAPANWYFNYCDEDGFCYPGSLPVPLSLNEDQHKGFHLNISVGDSGVADFHFQVTSTGLGTYNIPFRLTTDDVSVLDPVIPNAAISLGGSYPNPFRGTTRIMLNSIKAVSSATLDIYNLKGQRVDSLNRTGIGTGTTEIEWTPKDLPAGVYYYKLRNESAPAKRLLLMD